MLAWMRRIRRKLWERGLSTAHDPPVARLLWGLIVVAAVGAVLSRPVGYSVVDLLPPLGGVLVVLGSYFAARTLRENEVAQATQMLAGDNEAVRIAGVHRVRRRGQEWIWTTDVCGSHSRRARGAGRAPGREVAGSRIR